MKLFFTQKDILFYYTLFRRILFDIVNLTREKRGVILGAHPALIMHLIKNLFNNKIISFFKQLYDVYYSYVVLKLLLSVRPG